MKDFLNKSSKNKSHNIMYQPKNKIFLSFMSKPPSNSKISEAKEEYKISPYSKKSIPFTSKNSAPIGLKVKSFNKFNKYITPFNINSVNLETQRNNSRNSRDKNIKINEFRTLSKIKLNGKKEYNLNYDIRKNSEGLYMSKNSVKDLNDNHKNYMKTVSGFTKSKKSVISKPKKTKKSIKSIFDEFLNIYLIF